MMKRPPRRAGYFIRTKLRYCRVEKRAISTSPVLVELTRQELREVEAYQGPLRPRYRLVDGSYAHKWVRDGGQHETGLWIDYDKRIRYAESEPC